MWHHRCVMGQCIRTSGVSRTNSRPRHSLDTCRVWGLLPCLRVVRYNAMLGHRNHITWRHRASPCTFFLHLALHMSISPQVSR